MPWITGGAILGGALLSTNASNKAASGQAAAADSATAEQRRQFDLSRLDSAPYRGAGSAAINSLSNRLGLSTPTATRDAGDLVVMTSSGPMLNPKYEGDPVAQKAWNETLAYHNQALNTSGYRSNSDPTWISQQMAMRMPETSTQAEQPSDFGDLSRKFTMQDFMNDPVNQIQGTFAQDEARKAIERRAAVTTGWDSGATLKALTRFGSDYGNQRAGESYNRFVGDQANQFNRLASVAGIGQTSVNQTATLGANAATNIGNNTMQAANARGAAGVANANAINQGIGTGLNFMQNQQFLNRLQPQSPQVPSWNPILTGDFPNPQTLVG